MAVLAVIHNIVGIPFGFRPSVVIGEFLFRVLHLTLLGAELLAEFQSASRADLHALAACHAVFCRDVCTISGSRQIRSIEVLAGAQCEADAEVAVAQTEDLVGTIDVGGLVDIAVVLGPFADLKCFFFGNATAFAGLYQVVGEIAETDAAVVLNLTGALAEQSAGITAGAVTNGQFSVILVQPVRNVLQIAGFLFGRNGLFHGDDMHADTVASGRHQVGLAFQRKECHLIKAGSQLRVLLNLVEHHVGHLSNTGNEKLNIPLFFLFGILPMVLYDAVHCSIGQQFLDLRFGLAGKLCNFRCGLGFAEPHLQHDFRDLIAGACAIKDDIFRIIFRDLLDSKLLRNTVGNHLSKIE